MSTNLCFGQPEWFPLELLEFFLSFHTLCPWHPALGNHIAVAYLRFRRVVCGEQSAGYVIALEKGQNPRIMTLYAGT